MDDRIKISPQLLSKAGASTVRLAPGGVIFKVVMHPIRCTWSFPVWSRFTYEIRLLRPAAIDKRTFMLLVDEMPYFALFVMRNMVDRLRRMNEQWLSIRPAPFQGS